MLPLGSLGGFHLRMIWEEELDEEMGSSGTEGSGETSQKNRRRELINRNDKLHVELLKGQSLFIHQILSLRGRLKRKTKAEHKNLHIGQSYSKIVIYNGFSWILLCYISCHFSLYLKKKKMYCIKCVYRSCTAASVKKSGIKSCGTRGSGV